jgi:hypothetical protein
MSNPRGNYIVTYTGRAFYPMDPRAEDVSILDIGHALGHLCRFNGHVREFYSVAQHAVLASYLVPLEFALQALHHDDAEAYIGDMTKPLKAHMPAFQAVEATLWRRAIAPKFGLPFRLDPSVKRADMIMLRTEQRDLMPPSPYPEDEGNTYGDHTTPRMVWEIIPWSPEVARREYIKRHNYLTHNEERQEFLSAAGVSGKIH